MEKFFVNVYIETLIKGPRAREAAGEWLVEFTTSKGIPVTRNGIIWKEKSTENALVLELLRDALSILTKTCSIQVNTQCLHVFYAIKNMWPDKWKNDGWVNAKGKPVSNEALWQQAYKFIKKHSVMMVSEPHKYQDVMQHDIKKEMEKVHVEGLPE